MITLKIGTSERHFDSVERIDENWINQQINGLKKDKHSVCVRVSIKEGPLHLSLATADCSGTNGGGRLPNDDERKVFELWASLGLNSSAFQGGKIVAFFKQLHRIIR